MSKRAYRTLRHLSYAHHLAMRMVLRLSGARPEILRRCPGERGKFFAIGVSVLIAASLTVISTVIALRTAAQVPLGAAILSALFFGFTTLSLDYFLLASLARPKKLRAYLLTVTPRLLLAVLFSVVISTPLVLRIFAPEISRQIPVIQHQEANAFLAQAKSSPLAKKIVSDQAEVNRLQETISTGALTDPYQNQIVKDLVTQRNNAQAQAAADYKRWHCQLYGGQGCAAAGNEVVAKASEQAYLNATQQVDSLNNEITSTVEQIKSASRSHQSAALAAARAALPAKLAALRRNEQAQTQAAAEFYRANAEPVGLLIQLKALGEATSNNASLSLARWGLLAFLVVIECLPLLTRWLTFIDPETAYDEILALETKMTVQAYELAARQREALLLLETDRTLAEARAKLAREAYQRLLDDPEKLSEISHEFYSSLLMDRPGGDQPSSPSSRTQSPYRSEPGQAMPTTATHRSASSFTEQVISHADGQLRRLEFGNEEFLLIDSLNGAPTLNWTTVIGARGCALLIAERLGPSIELGGDGEIILSIQGVTEQLTARLLIQIASTASPSFDEQCDFLRFDAHGVTMALQVVPGEDGKPLRIFGISSGNLDQDTLMTLILRTGTQRIVAHALEGENSTLMAKIAELTHLPAEMQPITGNQVENRNA